MSAELIARLIEAGTPAALVAEVAMALGRAEGDQAAIVARRQRDADRQREKRERDKIERENASRDITLRHGTSEDRCDETVAPALSPNEILNPYPTPTGNILPARESRDPVPVVGKLLAAQIAIDVVLAGLVELRRVKWKALPPPAGVSDDLWRSFLDYRRSKRQTMTIGAYRPLVTKLTAFTDDEWPPGKIIEEIMDRGWLTFKPEWLKRNSEQRNGQRNHHERPSGWAPRPGLAGIEPASLDD